MRVDSVVIAFLPLTILGPSSVTDASVFVRWSGFMNAQSESESHARQDLIQESLRRSTDVQNPLFLPWAGTPFCA